MISIMQQPEHNLLESFLIVAQKVDGKTLP